MKILFAIIPFLFLAGCATVPGHDVELASFDFALPAIGDQVFDAEGAHKDWFLPQIACEGAWFWYRDMENNATGWREFLTIDTPATLLSFLPELLFPPVKGN